MKLTRRKQPPPSTMAMAASLLWALGTATQVLSLEELSPAIPPLSDVPDCFDSSVNLTPCLTFIENVSRTVHPEERCCPAVAVASVTDTACLCRLLSGPDILGVELNSTKAVKLPFVCNIQIPAVSPCTELGMVASIASSGSSIFRASYEVHSIAAVCAILSIVIIRKFDN